MHQCCRSNLADLSEMATGSCTAVCTGITLQLRSLTGTTRTFQKSIRSIVLSKSSALYKRQSPFVVLPLAFLETG